jgi:hypothetical protein
MNTCCSIFRICLCFVSCIGCKASSEKWGDDYQHDYKLEGMWNKIVVVYLMVLLQYCLEGSQKNRNRQRE